MHRVACLVILSMSVAFLGCGRSDSTVSGKITYKEQALNSGTVTWVSAGAGKSFPISESGTYSATGLSPGKYKVAVITPNKAAPIVGPPTDKKGTAGTPPVQVDAKYHKAETSGLEYEVKAGSQSIDIALPK